MYYESFFYKLTLIGIALSMVSSCSKDSDHDMDTDGVFKLNLSGCESLVLMKSTPDDSTPNLYSIDANGLSSPLHISLAQNKNGTITETDEKIPFVVRKIRNVSEEYFMLSECYNTVSTITSTTRIPEFMLVRKSDGMIYNLYDIGFDGLNDLSNEYECPIIEEGLNNLIAGCYTGTQTSGIDDMHLLNISPSVSSNNISFQSVGNTTFSAQSYNKLFSLENGIVAFGSFAKWGMNAYGLPFMPKILNCGGIVYGNGLGESLGSVTNGGTTYAFLSDGYISMKETVGGANAIWHSLDSNTGGQTSEDLGLINHSSQVSSWYETNNAVLIKYYVLDETSHYMMYDKTSKTFTDLNWSCSGYDNMELWKENLNGENLWGLTCTEPNKIENAIRINPFTLEYEEIPLNLGDIRIQKIIPDFKNGQVQLIATNENEQQVIVNINLNDGCRKTVFGTQDKIILNAIKL